MTRTKYMLLALALIVMALSTSGWTQSQTKTQWEYKIEDRCFDEGRINALGAQGWEIGAMAENNTGGRHCVFKRMR